MFRRGALRFGKRVVAGIDGFGFRNLRCLFSARESAQGFILFSGAVSALPGAVAAVEMPFAASIVWSFGWVFVSDVNLLNKRIKIVTGGVCLTLFTLLLFV